MGLEAANDHLGVDIAAEAQLKPDALTRRYLYQIAF